MQDPGANAVNGCRNDGCCAAGGSRSPNDNIFPELAAAPSLSHGQPQMRVCGRLGVSTSFGPGRKLGLYTTLVTVFPARHKTSRDNIVLGFYDTLTFGGLLAPRTLGCFARGDCRLRLPDSLPKVGQKHASPIFSKPEVCSPVRCNQMVMLITHSLASPAHPYLARLSNTCATAACIKGQVESSRWF